MALRFEIVQKTYWQIGIIEKRKHCQLQKRFGSLNREKENDRQNEHSSRTHWRRTESFPFGQNPRIWSQKTNSKRTIIKLKN